MDRPTRPTSKLVAPAGKTVGRPHTTVAATQNAHVTANNGETQKDGVGRSRPLTRKAMDPVAARGAGDNATTKHHLALRPINGPNRPVQSAAIEKPPRGISASGINRLVKGLPARGTTRPTAVPIPSTSVAAAPKKPAATVRAPAAPKPSVTHKVAIPLRTAPLTKPAAALPPVKLTNVPLMPAVPKEKPLVRSKSAHPTVKAPVAHAKKAPVPAVTKVSVKRVPAAEPGPAVAVVSAEPIARAPAPETPPSAAMAGPSNADLVVNGPPAQNNVVIVVPDFVPEGPKEDNVRHFRALIARETLFLTSQSKKWRDVLASETEKSGGAVCSITDDGVDLIRVAAGSAELFLTKKLQQFVGLVDDCEFDRGEKPISPTDLAGFWEMIFMQVVNIRDRFAKVEALAANNWIMTPEIQGLPTSSAVDGANTAAAPKRILKSITNKPKPVAAGKSKIREAIEQARREKLARGEMAHDLVKTDIGLEETSLDDNSSTAVAV